MPNPTSTGSGRPVRSALITGGAGGIGLATARQLLADGWGVTVADVDVGGDALRALQADAGSHGAASGALATVLCDVRDEAAVAGAVAAAVERFGTVTGLCTCAGLKRRGPLVETSAATWRELIDVNLTGAFLAIRHVLPIMISNSYGRIVTISSPSGYAEPNAAGYAAAKGAVMTLTRSLALEALPHHVAVNCIVPALTNTAMTTLSEQELAERGRTNVAGRVNTPDDIARVIRFLLGDESPTTSGAVLDVGRVQGSFTGV